VAVSGKKYPLPSTGIDPRVHSATQRALSSLGTDINALRTQAANLSDGTYEAADAAAWSGSPPATVTEALDRLAAALGPIA
jgi:hypothetical protein